MKFDDLLDMGYNEFKPTITSCANRACQKKVEDNEGNILYFISVFVYDINGIENYEAFIQFYQIGTHNALDLNFLNGWSIDDIEKYADFIYYMDTRSRFEPYE